MACSKRQQFWECFLQEGFLLFLICTLLSLVFQTSGLCLYRDLERQEGQNGNDQAKDTKWEHRERRKKEAGQPGQSWHTRQQISPLLPPRPPGHSLLGGLGETLCIWNCLLLLLFSCSSCSTLCDPVDCSIAGFLQTHVHGVSDAIQPSQWVSS